jgi:hypothetical protein
MQPIARNKRPGRQLLVAAIGIASVSYVGALNGCADVEPGDEEGVGAAQAAEGEGDLAETQQALTVHTDLSATQYKPLQPSGNLMPGPDLGTHIDITVKPVVIKVPIPVGNLMAPVEPGPAIQLDTAALAVEQR